MKSVILITKDATITSYFPTYGNRFWKTPNIDALAKKGTVFERHYTSAPSTAMAFLGIVTGKYPYEFDRKEYKHEEQYEGRTIFDIAKEHGLESHIVWSENYNKFALPFANCFKGAIIHSVDINQPVGPHIKDEKPIVEDENKCSRTLEKLFAEINNVPTENVFIWLHLPHVLLGRKNYGGDIDLLDKIVGFFRSRYGDDSIFISADHGNMNGSKGIYAYGYHVYEPAIRVPLITPKINNSSIIDFPTSHTQMGEILFNRVVSRKDYVVCESTYYLQANRKTAVIKDNYKLIRNKLDGSEELYDVNFDNEESRNLLCNLVKDADRDRLNVQKEVYFYPFYDDLDYTISNMKTIMNNVWRLGTKKEERHSRLKYFLLQILKTFQKKEQKEKSQKRLKYT